VTGTSAGATPRADHANPNADALEMFTTRRIPAFPARFRTWNVDSTSLPKVSCAGWLTGSGIAAACSTAERVDEKQDRQRSGAVDERRHCCP
jgi:hypothetical protein